ncbi:hypothetical protein X801_01264 [Opisthorchis viverrini]|uniref:Uncharacterized protein n=1 Tax=Opisthorchis viverrini TaxID=6198 RepID=A0A1S8X7U9_OPIVI|nr:hypothetical protein X801_01264 [Opisthorchis viverrini]
MKCFLSASLRKTTLYISALIYLYFPGKFSVCASTEDLLDYPITCYASAEDGTFTLSEVGLWVTKADNSENNHGGQLDVAPRLLAEGEHVIR